MNFQNFGNCPRSIDTFNRKDTPVYAATMDMSKAFDMVKWCNLFEVLRKRKVDAILLK